MGCNTSNHKTINNNNSSQPSSPLPAPNAPSVSQTQSFEVAEDLASTSISKNKQANYEVSVDLSSGSQPLEETQNLHFPKTTSNKSIAPIASESNLWSIGTEKQQIFANAKNTFKIPATFQNTIDTHQKQKSFDALLNNEARPLSDPVSEQIQQLEDKNKLKLEHKIIDSKPAETTTSRPQSHSPVKMSTVQTEDLNEVERDQKNFENSIKSCNQLVNPDDLYKVITKNVTKLTLHHSLPSSVNLSQLLLHLANLQILDLSYNDMGPQAFRSLCLGMCGNVTIISLNLSDNRADTDSSICIGRMLTENKTLEYLDVSGNSLGKDFFSRCIGPALKVNTSLKTLRAQSVNSVDLRVFLECLQENNTLRELDISSNQITDRTCLGKYLGMYIKSPTTKLSSLNVSNCNINKEGIQLFLQGLKDNQSLVHLNISGNEFGDMQMLCEVLTYCFQHKYLTQLFVNDARLSNTSFQSQEITQCNVSSLCNLRLSSSKITGQLLQYLAEKFTGKLINLKELDLSNNSDLKSTSLSDIFQLTKNENGKSGLTKLTLGSNDIESLSVTLKEDFSQLTYLNVRKAKCSVSGLGDLTNMINNKTLPLSTIVLDGLKLSGTEAFKTLNASLAMSTITALSLDGCLLCDNDLVGLADSIQHGLNLYMLKLSANRLTDGFTDMFIKSLLQVKDYPLAVLDLSNNQLDDKTSEDISKLYTTAGYKTSLHSINLQSNNLGSKGILNLISCMGSESVLKTLYVNNQRNMLEEAEVFEIYLKLASILGYGKENENDIKNSSDSQPTPFYINLSGLGGHVGDMGYKLDCSAIVTDLSSRQLLNLSLSNIMEIVSVLKGNKEGECILCLEDFNIITGANKDREVPSWLQLSNKRDLGLYISNLPGNATVNKLEAIFEMEADCNVDEVVLTKDPVSRSNSGIGWLLMSDADSVQKALNFFTQGEARIFGQPFMISKINVKIHDTASLEAENKARQDMEERLKQRKLDDAAHRQLILQNTEESWKRHAYRLAHPAYADGRIW